MLRGEGDDLSSIAEVNESSDVTSASAPSRRKEAIASRKPSGALTVAEVTLIPSLLAISRVSANSLSLPGALGSYRNPMRRNPRRHP
jgi:hypothetical protein